MAREVFHITWALEPGAPGEALAERVGGLLWRFGGDDVRCMVSGDELVADFWVTTEAPGDLRAKAASVIEQTEQALEHDAYDYVDEYPWPSNEDSAKIAPFKDALEEVLRNKRLRFEIYPLFGDQEGIVVELHDPGGATPEESVNISRRLIHDAYNHASLAILGRPHISRHNIIGGITGDPPTD